MLFTALLLSVRTVLLSLFCKYSAGLFFFACLPPYIKNSWAVCGFKGYGFVRDAVVIFFSELGFGSKYHTIARQVSLVIAPNAQTKRSCVIHGHDDDSHISSLVYSGR